MTITPIQIPTTIKVLRLFKSNLVLANVFSLCILIGHFSWSVSVNDFSIFSAGGGLLSLISILLFLSYTTPTEEDSYLNHLKILYPLNHEKGIHGDIVTDQSLLKEDHRNVLGNKLLSVQSYYLIWTVIGTLIWSYGGFIELKYLQHLFCIG